MPVSSLVVNHAINHAINYAVDHAVYHAINQSCSQSCSQLGVWLSLAVQSMLLAQACNIQVVNAHKEASMINA